MGFMTSLFRGLRSARPAPLMADSIYREMAEQVADVLVHVGAAGLATYVSPSVERVFGRKPDEVIGTDALWLIIEEDRAGLIEAITKFHKGEASELRYQARARRPGGELVWIESTATAMNDQGMTVLVLRDITDRKRLEDELAAMALQDGLTGLANRRAFDQTLERTWNRTVRQGSQLSLLLLDLDHFKQFNDEYGHQAGDDCLRSVAAAIRSALARPGDVACRYGGEELAIVLGETGAEEAKEIAEGIRAAVEALQIPHSGSGCASVVTASVGIATALAREGGTIRMPEGLLQAADHALYRAKNEGRNRAAHSLLFAPGGEN